MAGFIVRQPDKDGKRSVRTDLGVLKICPCGRTFTPYRAYQKYCCNSCRKKYGGTEYHYTRQKEEEKECAFCGAKFKTRDSKKKYCGNKCYLLSQAARRVEVTERLCPICGQVFLSSHWSKKYCGSDCRAVARKERTNAGN